MTEPSSDPVAPEPSEAMIRIRRMINSGVVSVGDHIVFVLPAVPGSGAFEYAGELAADGRIVRPREVRAPTPPPPNSKFGRVEFQSPTSFGRYMLQFASSRLSKNRKPRSVNGWVDCTIGGEKLNDLFLQQLRKPKKNSASTSPSGSGRESKGSTPGSTEKRKEQSESRETTDSEKAEVNSKHAENMKSDSNQDTVEKKLWSSPQAESDNKKNPKDIEMKKAENVDKLREKSGFTETIAQDDKKEKSSSDHDLTGERKAEVDKKDSKVSDEVCKPKVKAKDNKMDISEDIVKSNEKSDKSSPNREPEKKSGTIDTGEGNETKIRTEKKVEGADRSANIASENNTGGENEMKFRSEKKTEDTDGSAKIAKEKGNDKVDLKKSSSKRKDKTDKNEDKEMLDSPSMKVPKSEKKSTEEAVDVTEEQEEGEVLSPPPAPTQKGKDDSSDDQSKKKSAKTQKRKRSITPQSDVEPSTRAKSRRRILDPAAAEAAAVAAAADKQEAISLRPTTRLKSGKIPKVVYNASPKTMAGEANESAAEEIQHSRSSSRREKPKRSSRRRTKTTSTEVSEEGGSSERDELELELEEKSQAVYLLSQLAYAVRRTGSTTPSTIVTELRGKSIDTEEAKGVLSEMMDNIRQVNGSVGFKSEGADLTDQMLAYLATEIARWKAGQPRPASVIARRKARLESKRATVEKLRRRGKREHDEVLSKLETEMDKRRTVDIDGAKVTIQLNTVTRELERQKGTLDAVMKEVRDVKMQEQDGRKRVEKTKRLFAQLVQVAKKDAPTAGVQNIGESITSNDEDVRVAQTQTGSTPTDPGRAAEVGRLRTLVRIREAEAEMWQRRCEMDCIKLRELQDLKVRLDNQLYRRRGRNVSRLLAAATTAKKKNDRSERNRQANGGGGQVGNGRSRGGPTGVTKGSRKNSRRDEKGKRRAGRPANS